MMWIVDQVPFWVWIALGLGIVGALFYFFSPILVPLWSALPKSVKVVLGAIGSIVLAILYGRYKGAKDERDRQAERERDSIENRRKIDEDVKNASDANLDKRADRWMRD